MSRAEMKVLASDVDAVKAVKEVFPTIEKGLERIDFCFFKHAWLNNAWEPGDVAGTLFYETNGRYENLQNIITLVINDLYKSVGTLRHKYTFSTRETTDGFALDVSIDPKQNATYQAEVNTKAANDENVKLLALKLQNIPGVYKCVKAGDEVLFYFNGQGFKITRNK